MNDKRNVFPTCQQGILQQYRGRELKNFKISTTFTPSLYDNPLNPSLVVKVWHSFPINFLLFDDTDNKKRQAEKGICHGIHFPNWQTLCSN